MTESQKKQAWITSLRLLAASPKSERELSRKLEEKGYDAAVIRETLQGLQQRGILNDRAYAQTIAARSLAGRPAGIRKISFEMKKHGIPPPIQEEILSGITPEQELERARETGSQRWKRFASIPIEKRKKRVYDFLIRRGFDFQIARDVLESLE